MKENKYNDEIFFNKYSEMERSKFGLNAAGEWESLKNILPSFENKNILDLGCGYGWHLIYAAQNKANLAVGCDISDKMLDVAREKTKNINNIRLILSSIENINENIKSNEELKDIKFDIVLSSLALHYVYDFGSVVKTVKGLLKDDGYFVFDADNYVDPDFVKELRAEGKIHFDCGKPELNSGKICEKGFTKGEEVCRMSQVGRRKGLTGDGKPE